LAISAVASASDKLERTVVDYRQDSACNSFVDHVMTVDALAFFNGKLQQLRDYHLSNQTEFVPFSDHCVSLDVPGINTGWHACRPALVAHPVLGKLALDGDLHTVGIPVADKVEPDQNTTTPQLFQAEHQYTNRTNREEEGQLIHRIRIKCRQTISKVGAVSIGKSNDIPVKLDARLQIPLLPVSLSVGYTRGSAEQIELHKKISVSDPAPEFVEDEQELEEKTAFHAAPCSETFVTHIFIRYFIPLHVSGTVVLDGPLAPNQEGFRSLSDVWPDASDRTLRFSSLIVDSSVIKHYNDKQQRRLNQGECEAVQ
jgi:hypothetical protein